MKKQKADNEFLWAICLSASDYFLLNTRSDLFWDSGDLCSISHSGESEWQSLEVDDFSKKGLGVLCCKSLFRTEEWSVVNKLISDKLHDVWYSELHGWLQTNIILNDTTESFLTELNSVAKEVPLNSLLTERNNSTIIENCHFITITDFICLLKKHLSNYAEILETLIPIGTSYRIQTYMQEDDERSGLIEKSFYDNLIIDFNQQILFFGHEGTERKTWRIKESEIKPFIGRRIYLPDSARLWLQLEAHIKNNKEFDFDIIIRDNYDKAKSVFNSYWRSLGKFALSNGYFIKELSDDNLFFIRGNNAHTGTLQIEKNKINEITRGVYSIQLTCKKV